MTSEVAVNNLEVGALHFDKENLDPKHAEAVKDEPKRFDAITMMKSPPQAPLETNDVNFNNVSLSTVGGTSPTDSGTSFVDETTLSTPPRDNKSPREILEDALDSTFDAVSETSGNSSPDLMIKGSRLILKDDDSFDFKAGIPRLDLSVISDTDMLQIDASGKDWIKIQHGGSEKMIMLPASNGSLDLATFEIAETLAAAFDIKDDVEIVGLTSAAVLSEDESMKFKHHGDVVFPLSFVASGQLKDIVRAGSETIPAFSLVTKRLCHFDNEHGLKAEFGLEDLGSNGELSFGEEREYTDAFIDLMQNSNAFSAVEKNVLLKFGINEANSGNILFRAAFRLSAFTSDSSRYVSGLKAIAKVIMDSEGTDDNDESIEIKSPPSKTLYGLVEFVSAADELLEGNDLTAEQYISVIDAIYSGHEEVEKLFELQCSPDFLLACEDEDLRGALLIKSIMALGIGLPPVASAPSEPSDELLKYAIYSGIHNFGTNLSIPVPREFRNIIYHMFSSGDEIVIAACKEFIESDDSEVMEAMILREWEIYCKNQEKFFQTPVEEELSGSASIEDAEFQEAPDLLVTAVAALVEMGDVSEDNAAVLIASYMRGNYLLREIFDHYVEHGNEEGFLAELKLIASDDQFISSRALASPTPKKFKVPSDFTKSEEASTVFKEALELIKSDDAFGSLEISALRLASVRKDAFLTNALEYYIETKDFETFKRDLSYVAKRVVHETEISMGA